MTQVVIIGGGPGGYEAALVASSLGAQVTLIDSDGIGGSAVLTDCVPSKALIATATAMTQVKDSGEVGVLIDGQPPQVSSVCVDLGTVNERIMDMASTQSADIRQSLTKAGVSIKQGHARFVDQHTVEFMGKNDITEVLRADVVLIAGGRAHGSSLAHYPMVNAFSPGNSSTSSMNYPPNSSLWDPA